MSLHDTHVHVALLIHDLHLQWHFFASSDGKETVDGIGGSIKCVITSDVVSQSHIVNDAASF